MTKKQAAAWLICTALMILGPGVAYRLIHPYLNEESTENRQLAEKPDLDLSLERIGAFLEGQIGLGDCLQAVGTDLETYPSRYDKYYNDNLPFRSQIIEKNSILSLNVFRDAASESVVLGKDEWLFYTGEESIEDYKGTNLYTEEELALIRDNMVSTRDYLAARGIEFVLMIPSNKEDIYSEELPDYIRKRGEMTRAEQVISCLEQEGIRICYPREELKAYSGQYDLYWHYDTHWNYLGGYIGAKSLLHELGVEVPAVEELTITPNTFSGYDLTGMMNLKSYYEKNRPADASYEVSGYPTNNMSVIKAEDATELIYQSDAPDARRLFLVRDSFAGAMAPVLASNFSYVYMPHWNGCFEPSQIEAQQPDIFVYEVVERRLDILLTFRLS